MFQPNLRRQLAGLNGQYYHRIRRIGFFDNSTEVVPDVFKVCKQENNRRKMPARRVT